MSLIWSDVPSAERLEKMAVTLTVADIFTARSGKPLSMKIASALGEKGASDGDNEQNRSDNVRRRYARNCVGNNSADTRYGT